MVATLTKIGDFNKYDKKPTDLAILIGLIGHEAFSSVAPYSSERIYKKGDLIYHIYGDKEAAHGGGFHRFSSIYILQYNHSDNKKLPPGEIEQCIKSRDKKTTHLRMASLNDILIKGGFTEEDATKLMKQVEAKIDEKIENLKFVAISTAKPSNPELQLWIKPILSRTVTVSNSLL